MKNKAGSVTSSHGGAPTNKEMHGTQPYPCKPATPFGSAPAGKKSGEYKGDKKNSQGYG